MAVGEASAQPIYPHSGTCVNCGRERDDLFWHVDDQAFYCADVFRCEARLEIQEAKGRPPDEFEFDAHWDDPPNLVPVEVYSVLPPTQEELSR